MDKIEKIMYEASMRIFTAQIEALKKTLTPQQIITYNKSIEDAKNLYVNSFPDVSSEASQKIQDLYNQVLI